MLLTSAWGCVQPRKPVVQSPTVRIPLKVWRVLALTDSQELPDCRTNVGCRLTADEIREQMSALRGNQSLFGHVEFVWGKCEGGTNPGVPCASDDDCNDGACVHEAQVIIHWQLPFVGRTQYSNQWEEQVLNAANWTGEHINIYFTGNVWHPRYPGQFTGGMNVDPQDATQHNVPLPYILINDGGDVLPSGFLYPPFVVILRRTMEHEVTHFLARFTNRTFGQDGTERHYDDEEHVPAGQENILSKDSFHKLVIPGRLDQPGTEQHEIWERVRNGRWDDQ